jgi:phosphohistidine phosphatase
MTNDQKCHLLLMRHAKSDWRSGSNNDFERPLTQRGVADAKKVAHWMDAHGLLPDVIVSSPSARTQATAGILVAELGLQPDLIRWEPDIYEAGLPDLLGVLGKYSDQGRHLLLIGHNPGLDTLTTYLASTEPGRTPSGKLMTTSALAIFSRVANSSNTPGRHSLLLQQIVRPKEVS